MTTDTLRSVRSLPKTAAAARPVGRRTGLGNWFSRFLAGAVPIDGGWAPTSCAAAPADGSSGHGDEVDR